MGIRHGYANLRHLASDGGLFLGAGQELCALRHIACDVRGADHRPVVAIDRETVNEIGIREPSLRCRTVS